MAGLICPFVACPSSSPPKLAASLSNSRPQFVHGNPNFTRSYQNTVASVSLRIGSASRNLRSIRCFSALTPQLKTTLDTVVTSHKIIAFIKGTKDFPQCGFSNTVVQIFKTLNVPFETINILENELLRQGLKEYSSWPTFPQVYIDGEFFGGCDIIVDAYKNGELQEVVERAICS
ncbi:Monothiol glutaredoxin-S7, chloroplastic [Castilleja foliolosa]|uniref:Monothiol glutaredoxin-S7, chloroplastic n=1 Tax=Castilleja foliolosa TaxID=1961234 RepID=A0ABD3EHL2_9LAMI